jgi:hypothetical protein
MLAACAPRPEPRSVLDFMEEGHARDGVLSRCNRDRDATLNEPECVNARRAAAALAIEAERARAAKLEREPEAERLALREREGRGPALPSAAGSPTFNVYANGSEALGPPALEITVEPPANELVIASPRIELTELRTVPRSLGTAEER